MKKIVKSVLLIILLSTVIVKAQTTTPYVEINTGFSTGIIPVFPGASVLYGETTKYNSGFLLDYEVGISFPTLITGKIGVGYDIEGTELSVGVRPWPPATYGQIRLDRPNKKSDIILSIEGMMWSEQLFVQRAIFTVGWRFDNKKYKDIRSK